jgi:hypothetical protein
MPEHSKEPCFYSSNDQCSVNMRCPFQNIRNKLAKGGHHAAEEEKTGCDGLQSCWCVAYMFLLKVKENQQLPSDLWKVASLKPITQHILLTNS